MDLRIYITILSIFLMISPKGVCECDDHPFFDNTEFVDQNGDDVANNDNRMDLSIIYGTTKGHSKALSDFIKTKLLARSDVKDISIFDVKELPTDFDALKYKGSITGGRVNAGMVDFMTKNKLNPKTTAYGQVSLGATGIDRQDLTETDRAKALKGVTKTATGVFETIGWKPDTVWYIGGRVDGGKPGWLMSKILGWWVGFSVDFEKEDQTDYEKFEKNVMEWVDTLSL